MTLMGVSFHNYENGGWASEGMQAAWAAGNIAADTGQLDAGIYDFVVAVGSAAGLTANNFRLQHRDADNAVTLHYQMIGASAAYFGTLNVWGYKIGQDERLRVYCQNAYGNPCQISIFWTRRV